MKKSFLIIIALVCVMIGCKVDDTGLPKPSPVNSLLIGKWYIKSAINNEPGYPADTVTSFTNKDYFIFNNDNTVKASSSNPDTSATTRYAYTNNTSGQQIIIGDAKNGFTTYTINKLTTDSLIMSWTLTITFGNVVTTIPSTYKLAHK